MTGQAGGINDLRGCSESSKEREVHAQAGFVRI
jgi:hypothetical protein